MEDQQIANISEGCRVEKVGRRFRSDEERQAILNRYRESGLSRMEFAQREGIRPGTFNWWLSQKPTVAAPKVRFQSVDTKPFFRGERALAEIEYEGKRIRLLEECSQEFIRRMILALK